MLYTCNYIALVYNISYIYNRPKNQRPISGPYLYTFSNRSPLHHYRWNVWKFKPFRAWPHWGTGHLWDGAGCFSLTFWFGSLGGRWCHGHRRAWHQLVRRAEGAGGCLGRFVWVNFWWPFTQGFFSQVAKICLVKCVFNITIIILFGQNELHIKSMNVAFFLTNNPIAVGWSLNVLDVRCFCFLALRQFQILKGHEISWNPTGESGISTQRWLEVVR